LQKKIATHTLKLMTSMDDSTNQNDNETPLEGLEHLVPDFLNKRKIELKELETFIADRNYDQIRQLTHKWKGYSAPYGFGKLGLLAEGLNALAHQQATTEMDSTLVQIKQYLSEKEVQFKDLK